MQFGVALPNVTGGSPAAIEKTASAAEALGWDSAWVADHILVGRQDARRYDGILEALATLSFVTAGHPKLAIGTAVLVVPTRNAVVLGRQLATLDLLSAGQLIVGVGLGSIEREYGNLGAQDRLAQRGARLDEAIQLWRHLWSGGTTSFRGRFNSLDDFTFAPLPPQRDRIPIWVGGASEAALRRAVLADGHVATQLDPAGVRNRVAVLDSLAAQASRPRPTMAVRLNVTADDLADGGKLRDLLSDFDAAGTDHLIVGLPQGRPERIADDLRTIGASADSLPARQPVRSQSRS